MNPVLLKPTGDRRSQVIVEGRPIGNLTVMEYHRIKTALRGRIRAQKGLPAQSISPLTMMEFREREFDRIAAIVRSSLDMDAVYRIVRGEV